MMQYFNYRWRNGMWSWVLHRLSGLCLIGYLVAHIWVTHHLSRGEQSFDQLMALLANPYAKLLEIGLIGVVLYHSLNGFRVLLVDLVFGIKYQKALFWVLMAVGIMIMAVVTVKLFPQELICNAISLN